MFGNDKTIEHRRFKRGKLEMLVGVIRAGQFSFEFSCEVSEGGMLLSVYNQYKVSEEIEISFFMPPNGEVILVRGEVVYGLEPEPGKKYVGIRFLDPSSFTQLLIRQYIAGQKASNSL